MTRTLPAPPARGLRLALATADPGLGRLRSAATTVAVLAVTAGVVLGGAALVGGPVTAAVTGVVLAFVTGIAGRDQPSPEQVVITAWATLGVSVSAVLSALVGGAATPPGIAVFVALGVVVVFLQRLGPRGFAAGMAGFITFLATTLTRLTPDGLPLAIGGAVLAAATIAATRWLLRTRRPERAARHALDGVEARAGLVVLALADVLRVPDDERARGRVDRRLAGLRRTATVADDRLADVSDRDAGVRVFDLRLGVEHLADLVTGGETGSDPQPALAALAERVGRALLDPDVAVEGPDDGSGSSGEVRVRRTMLRVLEEWRRPPGRPAPEDAASDDDEDDVAGPPPAPVADTVRRAVQVALAVALAALVGQWISSMQWFFAVVIAFVVFISSSSRGAVLSEGWQRTLGTLLGVVVGVGLATLLDGAVVPTVVLLAVCLFGALYVIGLSSTVLMVFITVGIALVYGLIGRFTVDVLLLRLAETAVGAGIGIAVSFLVLPTRTRATFAEATARFLRALRAVIDDATATLTSDDRPRPLDEGAVHELRDAHAAVEAAASPLTDGLAGALDRAGHRDALRVVGACDHHARLLLRLAGRHGAVPGAGAALAGAAAHVSDRVGALAGRLDRQAGDDGAGGDTDDTDDHGRLFGALDDAAARRRGDGSVAAVDATGSHPDADRVAAGDVLDAVGGRLRAIDRALTDLDGRWR